ncbi:MAG: M23 family metallopeptidase, partial [Ruminococcus sp.]|nr:M23 family metallopeptidase [Ruminococcus sp.]
AYELATLTGGIAVTGYVANENTEVMTAEVESVEVYAKDEEETEVVNDDINESLVTILGEGNNAAYPVITSDGLVSIKLDAILIRDSSTDTDMDSITDWKEVNTDLIEELHPSKSSVGTLRYTDLPTLGECLSKFSEYGYAYVAEGFNQIMSSEPMNVALKYPILPINSNPVDADGDNDGIPDEFDLNGVCNMGWNDINLTKIDLCYDKRFDIVKIFNGENYLNVKTSNFAIYNLPDMESKVLCQYNDIKKDNEKLNVTSVIVKGDTYWLKIKLHNGLAGYVLIDNIYIENTWTLEPNSWLYMFRDNKIAKNLSANYGYYPSRSIHDGIDIVDDKGKAYLDKYPIYSVTYGTVVFASEDTPSESAGYYVVVRTDNGYTVRYLHMRYKPFVKTNDRVTPYTMLGILGRTGRCSPLPHNNEACKTLATYDLTQDETEAFYEFCDNHDRCSRVGAHLHFDVECGGDLEGYRTDPKKFFNDVIVFNYNSGVNNDDQSEDRYYNISTRSFVDVT